MESSHQTGIMGRIIFYTLLKRQVGKEAENIIIRVVLKVFVKL